MKSKRVAPVVVLLLLATSFVEGLDIERLLNHRINVNKRGGDSSHHTRGKSADDYYSYDLDSSNNDKFDVNQYLKHLAMNSDYVFFSEKIIQALPPLLLELHEKIKRMGDADRCQPYVPFRCPGEKDMCISIQYLCDGASDCPDGYDEDPRLCTAAKRPPVAETANFLQSLLANHGPNYLEKLFGTKARDALAPLGGVTKVAVTLSESQTIEDFGKALHLMRADLEHLRSVFMAVENGDLGMLKSLGIKDSELGDVKFFLDKLVNTGFMD